MIEILPKRQLDFQRSIRATKLTKGRAIKLIVNFYCLNQVRLNSGTYYANLRNNMMQAIHLIESSNRNYPCHLHGIHELFATFSAIYLFLFVRGLYYCLLVYLPILLHVRYVIVLLQENICGLPFRSLCSLCARERCSIIVITGTYLTKDIISHIYFSMHKHNHRGNKA